MIGRIRLTVARRASALARHRETPREKGTRDECVRQGCTRCTYTWPDIARYALATCLSSWYPRGVSACPRVLGLRAHGGVRVGPHRPAIAQVALRDSAVVPRPPCRPGRRRVVGGGVADGRGAVEGRGRRRRPPQGVVEEVPLRRGDVAGVVVRGSMCGVVVSRSCWTRTRRCSGSCARSPRAAPARLAVWLRTLRTLHAPHGETPRPGLALPQPAALAQP